MEIFGGDCEVIDLGEKDDTPVGVRFDEEKMIKFCLEKLYPYGGVPDGLFEKVLGRLTDYETGGAKDYLFLRDASRGLEGFHVPYVSDNAFCRRFFLGYLELRLDDYRAQKRRSKE